MQSTIKVRFQRFVGRLGRHHVAALAALTALTMATSPVDSQPPPRDPVITDSTEVHFVPFWSENRFNQEVIENGLQDHLGESDVDIFPMDTFGYP